MNVLAVTSQVVYGHVGGQAAVLPLQLMGHEVWHLPTVLYSNHPAHGGFTGKMLAPERLEALLHGLAERGFLDRAAAILSGYLGRPETAELVADTVRTLRASGRDLVYCCDPVLGDDGRLYVEADLVELIAQRLAPKADIVTPNRYELGLLTAMPVETPAEVLSAAKQLRHAGAGIVVCTSAEVSETIVTTIAATEAGCFAVDTVFRKGVPHGTGDLFAAAFLARYLDDRNAEESLRHAAAVVDRAISVSLEMATGELELVAARAALARPEPLPELRRLD